MIPRGIRNNNPGNIENAGILWQGMIWPPIDPPYLSFQTPEHGIRAIAVDLYNAFTKDRLVTINAIIAHWTATDVFAYQRAVSSFMEIPQGVPLDLKNAREMGLLIRAIIKQENGKTPMDWSAGTEYYTLDTIAKAMTMAEHWGTVTADMLK